VNWNSPPTTTLSTMSYYFISPTQTTYYCALVDDSSVPAPGSLAESPSAVFTIEPLLAVQSPALSTTSVEVTNPMYEGTPVTATITWSGGTGPFDVTLYQDLVSNACNPGDLTVVNTQGGSSNPLTGVSKSPASITFLAPNTVGTVWYCVTVTDQNTGQTVSSVIGTKLVTAPGIAGPVSVTSPVLNLFATGPPLAAPGTDVGQSESATAYVYWQGGTAPYTITLYSGSNPTSCSKDTTVVSVTSGTNPVTGYYPSAPLNNITTFFVFASPKTTTFYCAVVSDASNPASVASTGVVAWVNNPPLAVSLPLPYNVEAGEVTTITATATGGTAPYYFQWFIGSSCTAANAISGAPPSSVNPLHTGVLSAPTTFSVQVVDSSNGSPAASACATISIGMKNGPLMVAVYSSGLYAGTAYVVGTSQGENHELTILDSDSMSVIGHIPFTNTLTGNPLNLWGVAVTNTPYPLGWVTGTDSVTGAGVLCYFSPATNIEGGCFPVGNSPQGLAINGALAQVYVANNADNTVSVYDYTVNGITATLNVGPGPKQVAVDPNTNTVFVTDNLGNTLSVLVPSGASPFSWSVTTVPVGFKPWGVAVNPANDNVLVTNYGDGTVSVLNGFTYSTIATIKIGDSPRGIAIDSVANVAYVADYSSGAVSIINLATNTVSSTSIPVGSGPYGVAFFASPTDPTFPSLVFVTNNGSNTVSVINADTNTIVATIPVP